MGRSRSRETREAAFSGDPISPAEFDQYDLLDKLKAESGPGGGWTVRVYKRSADGNRIDTCRKYQLDGFDIDRLPVDWGGGEFLLKILDERGTIKGEIRQSWDEEMFPKPHKNAPAPANGQTDLGRELAERDRRHEEFIQRILLALVPGAGKTSGVDDLLKTIEVVQKLNGGGGVDKQIELLKIGVEIGAGMEPGKSPEGWAPLIMAALDKYGDAFFSKMGRPSAAASPAPARLPASTEPAPTNGSGPAKPASADSTGKPAPIPAELQPFAWLARYAPYIIDCAARHRKPAAIAAFIFEEIPDQHAEALKSFVAMPSDDRARLLAALDPRLAPTAEYVDQVAAELFGMFQEAIGAEESAAQSAPTH